jgi:hypothetical protein
MSKFSKRKSRKSHSRGLSTAISGLEVNPFLFEQAMTTMPGTAPQIFQFSVRDDATAQRIEQRRYCITYFTLTRYVGTEGKISFTIADLDRYLERRRERDLMSHSDGACLALAPQVREVLSEKRITS